MRFGTPHGSWRYVLPWTWSSFDYRELCLALWAQCGDARFVAAKVSHRTADGVMTDRGELRAPLVVDALGWRRVLADAGYQPPDAPLSRGLEVHPRASGGRDLDVWVDRSLVRAGYAWQVPAAGEQRVGVGSYAPRDHVKEPVAGVRRPAGDGRRALAGQLVPAQAAPGRRRPDVLRWRQRGPLPAAVGGGDPDGVPLRDRLRARAAGGARRAARRLMRRSTATRRSPRRTPAPTRSCSPASGALPRVPPRVLTAGASARCRTRRSVRRAFTWYLDQAPPPTRPARLAVSPVRADPPRPDQRPAPAL